ncbi:MAG: hypothetical protein JRG77_05965 [Deltaproteobacteria bacterium]|nr:hypothetical protein [Deltaproteobacteria bacterium]MBW2098340.1 hypothetical protein [Deltaproteobacteria bacterium]
MKKTVIISKQKDCDHGLIALRNNSIPACFSPRQLFPLLEAFSLTKGMNKKEGERHEKDSDYF